MRQDIILVVNEGQTIPTSLAEKAVKEHPSALGVSYLDNDKGLLAASESAGLLVNDFEQHQKDFIDRTRVYHFAKAEGEVKNDDLQPHILLQVGEEIVAVAFVEGRFDVENPGQLTDGTVMAQTVLKPMFEDMWEICQQDVEKLELRMKGKTFPGEMERLCKPFKSSIVFMLSNGHVIPFSKSETQATAPWGFTSSMLGLKEGVFPASEAPAEPEKKKIGIKRTEAPPTAVPAVPAAGTGPQPEVRQVGATTVINKGPTASDLIGKTVAAVYEKPKMVWVVPVNGMRETKIPDWYHKRNNGQIPTNHRERPPIQMLESVALKQSSCKILGPVKEGENTYKAFSELPKEQIKTVEPAKAPAIMPSGPVEVIPTYPIDETKKVGELIQNNKHVMDPANLAKIEEKYPTFWKNHGISAERTLQFSLALRMDIAKTSPLQAAHAWQNSDYQRKLISDELLAQMEENEKLQKELAELKTKTAVAAEPQKKMIGVRR